MWQESRKSVTGSHGKVLEFLRNFSGRVKKRSMADVPTITFGPYRLDPANARLWRETQPLRLTPKAFQVLCYLAERPGQLVSKDELFQAVWTDTIISEATLTSAIQEIRKALADNAREPQYVETVPKRGFRFIGEVVSSQHSVVSQQLGSLDEAQRNPGETSGAESRIALRSIRATELPEEPRLQVIASPSAPLRINSAKQSLPEKEIASSPELSSLDEALRLRSGQAPRNPGETSEAGSRIALRSIQATELPVPPPEVLPLPAARLRRFRWYQVLGLIVLLVLGGGLAANWRLARLVAASYFPPPVPEPIALPLPDKPSIVVLPLVNLSNDPEQEYFSDGLTEDLIQSLSRIPNLFVIARQSAFTYKGKAVKIQDIGRELGVKYMLEGSVRKAENQVRVSVRLVEASTGTYRWEERYERPLTNIFTLQDEIVQKIVTTLNLQITVQEQGWIGRKRTANVDAYDALLRGVASLLHLTPTGNLQARQFFEQAVALDPQYGQGYGNLGHTYFREWAWRWSADPQTLERAEKFMQHGLALDNSYAPTHALLAELYALTGRLDQALTEIDEAIVLEPGRAETYAIQAEVLVIAGRPAEAVQAGQQAIHLNPYAPPYYFHFLGWAYFSTDQYAESIAALKQVITRNPLSLHAYPFLAFNYAAQWIIQQSHDPKILDAAYDVAQNAIALNDDFPAGHTALGFVYLWQKQYDDAITEFERAVALDKNNMCGAMFLALGLSQVGRVEEAVQVGERALSLKALPSDDRCLFSVASVYALAGRREEAAALYLRMLKQFPNVLGAHLDLAAIYSKLGRETEARAAAAEVLRINPQFSLKVHRQRVPLKDLVLLEQYIAALRKAGLE
jgi:TolB-like protein/DNA-binding winged helix-turn-helix (wHTH) protein/Tfp pilus assembly protein PilF